MTIDELAQSFLVTGGPTPPAEWDGARRAQLVENLSYLVGQLRQVGIDEIFVDGSFATTKPSPGDIDAYFVTDLFQWRSQLQRLNAMDPTWTYAQGDRKPNLQGKLKWPQWFRYHIEMFYVFRPPYDHLSFMGKTDPPVPIHTFFRSDTAGKPRGLVRIVT
jgi:hypothetical protein